MVRRTWHSCQPVDLHRLARRYFLHARRIELQKLARELGISRATAYRWAGSADQLVGEVLAALTRETFERLVKASEDKEGRDRVLYVLNEGMRSAHEFPGLRRFLRKNPETGLKVVASKDGPVQAATMNSIRELLVQETQAGHLSLPVDPAVMAFALTRMIESFLYADVISGVEPDLDSASKILEIMLAP